MDDVPIDVLAERLGTSRGAIYKTLHDARAKLRRALIEAGYGEQRVMTDVRLSTKLLGNADRDPGCDAGSD